MGIVEVWSVIAVVLHFVGIGSFAEWPIIAWPTHWSCLCLDKMSVNRVNNLGWNHLLPLSPCG